MFERPRVVPSALARRNSNAEISISPGLEAEIGCHFLEIHHRERNVKILLLLLLELT